jgi:molybdenum cofactor biosynthesis protein B
MNATPIGIAVLTVSDSRTLETDTSGALLVERVETAGHRLMGRALIADDMETLRHQLTSWRDTPNIDVILTTGGTGLTGRDVTADIVASLGSKQIPGFGELFRWLSFKDIGTSTIQSRALGVLMDTTLCFALPGSTGACRLAWDDILVKQLDSRTRPCNLVALMPRFSER